MTTVEECDDLGGVGYELVEGVVNFGDGCRSFLFLSGCHVGKWLSKWDSMNTWRDISVVSTWLFASQKSQAHDRSEAHEATIRRL